MNLIQLLGVKSKQPLGGRYQLIQPLGQGGFGHTFLATDRHLPNHPTCVIKQLKPHLQDRENLVTARRLFETEARVLYQLGEHPQIPRLLAHFEDRQEFYLAQELIEGDSLADLMQPGRPWSEAQVRQLLLDILTPLTFVHGKGVIHRDLKPSNLIRRRSDGHMVLIDFGAVKQVSERRIRANFQQVSQTISIGTQGYMPNEQLAGTPWFSSDLYALGMICLQALTGMAPHLLRRHGHTNEILWQSPDLAVSDPFRTVLSRMVRYDFRDRYPTAQAALADLETMVDGGQHIGAITGTGPIPYPTESITAPPSPITPLPPHRSSGFPRPPLPTASMATGRPSLSQPLSPHPMATAPDLGNHKRQMPWSILGLSLLTVTALGFLPGRHMSFNLAAQSPDPSPQSQPLPTESAAPTVPVPWEESASTAPVAPPTAPLPAEAAPLATTPPPGVNETDPPQPPQNETAPGQLADPLDQVESYWDQCDSLNQLQAYHQAIEACDRALSLAPDHMQSLWSKGYALEQQGNPQAALAVYDKILELDAKDIEAWNNRGSILLKQQQFAAALAAFDQARALAPNLAEAWSNRGVALWNLGQGDAAIAAIDQALELQPDYPEAQTLRDQIRQTLDP